MKNIYPKLYHELSGMEKQPTLNTHIIHPNVVNDRVMFETRNLLLNSSISLYIYEIKNRTLNMVFTYLAVLEIVLDIFGSPCRRSYI